MATLRTKASANSAQRTKDYLTVLLLALSIGWNLLLWVQRKGEWFFCDAYNRWQECAYTLHGVNPFAIISGAAPLNDAIGQIPPNCGTVPWAYLLGNVFQPGFLPWNITRIYTALLMPVLALLATAVLAVWLRKKEYIHGKRQAVCTAVLILLPAAWASTFYYGNQTGFVLGFIVLAFCVLDRYPVCAGILLGFAMCKPQIAFVFFWPLLLKGKFKTVITSIVTVVAAWAAAAWITGSNMLTMLLEIFNQGTGLGSSPSYMYGLFDGLLAFGQSTRVILLLDFAAALLLFAAAAIWLFTHRCAGDTLAWLGIAAVISIIWFYKQPHDFIVLGLVAVCLTCVPRIPPASMVLLVLAMDEILFNTLHDASPYMSTQYLAIRLVRMLVVLALLPCVLHAAKQRLEGSQINGKGTLP